ncbi:cell wall hydrolase [Bacillus massiliglaciei]|uniref:cell wall hydrolase n=1 Tax=Bacillus massiliglaciei TaxID=1816693 RepID=UPI000ADDDD32|nr:cell wall hydrolase [Bacillus massiliglaciei]
MKMKTIFPLISILTIILAGGLLPGGMQHASAKERKHVVKQGETLWDVAKEYGVQIKDLKKVNKNKNNAAEPGDRLIIPESIKPSDKELLARLVHAEAKGEPYRGKVNVASVILNRIEDQHFPDTVPQVIYQKRQFSPVDDGSIRRPAGKEAKKAVNEALAIHGYASDALYFWNPSISDSEWMKTRKVIEIIGGHHFAI